MSEIARALLALTLLAAAAAGLVAEPRAAEEVAPPVLRGACYCLAAGTLLCTANLGERECRQRCDEALCDEWFWKERLPCWNWGYGG